MLEKGNDTATTKRGGGVPKNVKKLREGGPENYNMDNGIVTRKNIQNKSGLIDLIGDGLKR